MRVNLLFMSPIILKYLPFCASQLPVSLQCDKRLLAPSLNPFLLRPISFSISAGNRHHINLVFQLKTCCLNLFFSPAGSSLFRVVPLGIIWAFDQVSVTLFNILFRSVFVCLVCVFELLYIWLLSLKRNNTCVHFCTLYACVVGLRVCALCTFKKKRKRKSNSVENELWSMYRYLRFVARSAWVNEIHVQKVLE